MAINWAPIYKKYRGKWVALKGDEKTVVASGGSAKAVFQLAQRRGERKPILTKIPRELIGYVG